MKEPRSRKDVLRDQQQHYDELDSAKKSDAAKKAFKRPAYQQYVRGCGGIYGEKE